MVAQISQARWALDEGGQGIKYTRGDASTHFEIDKKSTSSVKGSDSNIEDQGDELTSIDELVCGQSGMCWVPGQTTNNLCLRARTDMFHSTQQESSPCADLILLRRRAKSSLGYGTNANCRTSISFTICRLCVYLGMLVPGPQSHDLVPLVSRTFDGQWPGNRPMHSIAAQLAICGGDLELWNMALESKILSQDDAASWSSILKSTSYLRVQEWLTVLEQLRKLVMPVSTQGSLKWWHENVVFPRSWVKRINVWETEIGGVSVQPGEFLLLRVLIYDSRRVTSHLVWVVLSLLFLRLHIVASAEAKGPPLLTTRKPVYYLGYTLPWATHCRSGCVDGVYREYNWTGVR